MPANTKMSTNVERPPDADRPAALGGRLRKFRTSKDVFRWDEVALKRYKHEGTHFRDISRQTLFSEEDDRPCELRYFEIRPGGHSTFERHEHTHAVVILRGRGRAVVGDQVADVSAFDLLSVPPQTWHQLLADDAAPLGFLCQVPCRRDRPTRPTAEDREALLDHPELRDVIRL